jgi:hypothetical protein
MKKGNFVLFSSVGNRKGSGKFSPSAMTWLHCRIRKDPTITISVQVSHGNNSEKAISTHQKNHTKKKIKLLVSQIAWSWVNWFPNHHMLLTELGIFHGSSYCDIMTV